MSILRSPEKPSPAAGVNLERLPYPVLDRLGRFYNRVSQQAQSQPADQLTNRKFSLDAYVAQAGNGSVDESLKLGPVDYEQLAVAQDIIQHLSYLRDDAKIAAAVTRLTETAKNEALADGILARLMESGQLAESELATCKHLSGLTEKLARRLEVAISSGDEATANLFYDILRGMGKRVEIKPVENPMERLGKTVGSAAEVGKKLTIAAAAAGVLASAVKPAAAAPPAVAASMLLNPAPVPSLEGTFYKTVTDENGDGQGAGQPPSTAGETPAKPAPEPKKDQKSTDGEAPSQPKQPPVPVVIVGELPEEASPNQPGKTDPKPMTPGEEAARILQNGGWRELADFLEAQAEASGKPSGKPAASGPLYDAVLDQTNNLGARFDNLNPPLGANPRQLVMQDLGYSRLLAHHPDLVNQDPALREMAGKIGQDDLFAKTRADVLAKEMAKTAANVKDANGQPVYSENSLAFIAALLANAESNLLTPAEKDAFMVSVLGPDYDKPKAAPPPAEQPKAPEAPKQTPKESPKLRDGYLAIIDTLTLPESKKNFLKQISASVVKAEMSGAEINAAAVIAQATLESGWGTSTLSSKYFNIFGVKAGSNWTGPTVKMLTKENVNGHTELVTRLFRVYGSYDEAIADYVSGIISQSQYEDARRCRADLGTYIDGLLAKLDQDCKIVIPQGKEGAWSYATDPEYKQKLLAAVDKNKILGIVAAALPETPPPVAKTERVGENMPPEDRLERSRYYERMLGLPEGSTVTFQAKNGYLHTIVKPAVAETNLKLQKNGGYPDYLMKAKRDALVDPWSMYNRECVSYTAFKVSDKYGFMPNWGGKGDAYQWPDRAREMGIPVNNTPAVGSVLIWKNSGPNAKEHTWKGHSAFVEAILPDGSLLISQMNFPNSAQYSVEIVTPQALKLLNGQGVGSQIQFLHFEQADMKKLKANGHV